jgi:hypothetical protein
MVAKVAERWQVNSVPQVDKSRQEVDKKKPVSTRRYPAGYPRKAGKQGAGKQRGKHGKGRFPK